MDSTDDAVGMGTVKGEDAAKTTFTPSPWDGANGQIAGVSPPPPPDGDGGAIAPGKPLPGGGGAKTEFGTKAARVRATREKAPAVDVLTPLNKGSGTPAAKIFPPGHHSRGSLAPGNGLSDPTAGVSDPEDQDEHGLAEQSPARSGPPSPFTSPAARGGGSNPRIAEHLRGADAASPEETGLRGPHRPPAGVPPSQADLERRNSDGSTGSRPGQPRRQSGQRKGSMAGAPSRGAGGSPMSRMTTAERQAQAEQRRAAILKDEERKRNARNSGVGPAAAAGGGGGGAGGRKSNQQRAVREAIERGKQQRARQLAQQKRHDKNDAEARSRRIAEVRKAVPSQQPRAFLSSGLQAPTSKLTTPPLPARTQMHKHHKQKEAGLDENASARAARQRAQKSEDEKRMNSINTAMSLM